MGLALCSCGTLGKGTFHMYPSLSVPTASTSKRLFDRCSGEKAAQASGRNQAEMPEGREHKNVVPDQADGKRSSEPKRAEGTKGSQQGGKGIRGARRCGTGDSAGV